MGNQNEIWKDIEGYEGKYVVSDMGRVKSLDYRGTGEERIMKQSKDTCGYLFVQLYREGKRKSYRVNRLVAITFIPNPENYPEVNHIDENRTNNCATNLEWCDRLYNNNYGTRNEKISKSLSKSVMCVETCEIFNSIQEAHEKTGINASRIGGCAIHKKKYRTARRLHWQFI